MAEKTRSTIICVDDEKMLLSILHEQLTNWLGKHYTVEKALGGEEALEIFDECAEEGVDVSVVISDYIMPNMKGDELLEKVKRRDPRIKTIMLTGYSSLDGIVSAINKAGLYRYITKPWDNRDLMLTIVEAVKAFEQEKKAMDLSKSFEKLYHKYEALYLNSQGRQDQIIRALAMSADARDPLTSGHSIRVAKYAVAMGRADKMSQEDLKFLEYAATLHDLGKIGMNDKQIEEISGLQLYNKGDFVKQQNQIAEEILRHMPDANRLIQSIKHHWEKYDGTGVYGLKGDQIPITASMISLANYYDLINSSVSRGQVMPPEAAANIIKNTSGTIFSPKLVDLFTDILLKGELR